jgi:hypothetical protein
MEVLVAMCVAVGSVVGTITPIEAVESQELSGSGAEVPFALDEIGCRAGPDHRRVNTAGWRGWAV